MFACIRASTDFVLSNSGLYFVADSSTDLTGLLYNSSAGDGRELDTGIERSNKKARSGSHFPWVHFFKLALAVRTNDSANPLL